ncbi:phosphopentomutase [Paenactinomyces guangxiensis]|uniref:Phosphopentomutase n=1 Tax=Paenactinomyces guangxiensis TaxID=1490290 RepID=A0A7W1WNM9_9BACL|nr:phosphopentomutase [Paenactinomyces guangxiensis]MBA4493224.1 phosphopentomutase [Paenactinomyces guangxiensis]MBH8589926.1 phosphopentomutase [Paenactinomyces guangxiensis]
MPKAILLVLDSFGIGAMEDCEEERPQDVNAHTYLHIREVTGLTLPTLYHLGLNQLVDGTGLARGAFGRAALAHFGADTYMGHQELMGSRPLKPVRRLMREVGESIASALQEAGCKVTVPWDHRPILLVEDAVVVADNIESDKGNIINVTADLSRISFADTLKIASRVRETVDVSRVIALGGPYTSIEQILSVVREHHPGQWGVDSPRAKVYGEGYQVRHLGYGVRIEQQFPYLAEQSGVPVYRIGKTADVLYGEGVALPHVETKQVLEALEQLYTTEKGDAAFLVTVQETDLAGHQENPEWYASLLQQVDEWLGRFLRRLQGDDLLIITADHGNDPTIGHSRHTREYTPILVTGPGVKPGPIGTRTTMADIGATLSQLFGLPPTESGTSFLREIYLQR